MQYKVITPVAMEPVTLAEVKMHRRLTSGTFAGDTGTSQSIVPGSHEIAASYGLEGAAINVLGVISFVNLNAGVCGAGGSITAKIQESDDNVSWQDFSGGAFTVVTEANDNAVQEIEYTGGKQYVRVVVTVAGAACEFSADVIAQSGEIQEDSYITELITAAREYCEGRLGRALATQTLEVLLDQFPYKNYIELPYPPLQSVTSVKYKNSDGTETTMTVDEDYIVDTDSLNGRIVLPYGVVWPSFTPYSVNPIRIRIVTGYYASNLVPRGIKQAMKLLIGHWYENREAVLIGQGTMSKEIEFAVDSLLAIYKAWWF